MKVLIIGKPGIGKTTLIKRIALLVPKESFGGFFTEEIKLEGERLGFKIANFDDKLGIMSHVKYKNNKVGRYGVDIETLDRIGVSAIESALKNNKLVVIDEIGKTELFSIKFQEIIKQVFDSNISILATIHQHKHPFTDGIKNRKYIGLIEITSENREKVFMELNERFVKFI